MTTTATLVTEISGRDVNLTALLQKLEERLRAADAAANRTGAGLGDKVGAGAQRASAGVLALQQAQARLEAQQGNLAGAADRLRNALAQQSTTTTQTIGAQRQLAAIEAQLAGQTRQLEGEQRRAAAGALAHQAALARLERDQGNLAGAAQRLRTVLAQQTSQTTQVIAARRQLIAVEQQLATGQSGLARAFSEAGGAAKASLAGMIGPAALATGAITGLTAVVRSFADAFVFKAQLDATTTSITAQLKGVRDSSQVFAEAQQFADRYKLTQQEMTQAIQASIGVMRTSSASTDDLLTTLARLQVLAPEKPIDEAARALRELASGDTTSIKELFNISAANANRMKAEIQGGADAVLVLSQFLDQSGIGMDALAAKTAGASGAMKDLAIAQEELTLAQAQFEQGPGLTILAERINITRGATRLLSADWETMRQSLLQATAAGDSWAISLARIMPATAGAGQGAQQAARDQLYHQSVLQGFVGVSQAVAVVSQQQAVAVQQAGQASLYQSQAMIDAANATTQYTAQLTTSAAQTLIAETNAQNLARRKEELRAAAIAAAGGLGTTRQQAALLAAQMNITEGEAYDLINALRQIPSSPIANVGKGLTSGLSGALPRVLERTVPATGVTGLITNLDKATDAMHRFNTAASGAPVRGGGGGARGGGGSAISEQTKLSNQLLADQERFQDRAEDAALKHAQKLFEIERSTNEKRLAAQRAFQQARADSDASFYRSIGDIADNALQQQASAQFEAALLESERIGREKGADAAKAYLEARREAILQDTKTQEEINKAQAEGDGGRAEFLTGVQAKERKAADERLRQIEESGSAIEAERQRQIATEEQSFAESQGRMAGQAEDSANRRITAAERAGKAIDPERLAVQGLTTDYEKLNRVSGRGAAAGGNGAPTVPVGAAQPMTAPAGAAPTELGAVAELLNQAITAIRNVETATRDGASKVAGAVSSGRAYS